jgi:hypothetical protein
LPALEHHTYSEDDVEEGGIKIKKNYFVHENFKKNYFYSKSPLLDVGTRYIKKYSPNHPVAMEQLVSLWCTDHGNQFQK